MRTVADLIDRTFRTYPGKNTWNIALERAPSRDKVSVEAAYKPRSHTKSLAARWKSGEHLYTNQHLKDGQAVVKKVTLKGGRGKLDFSVPSDNTDDPAYPKMLYILYKVAPK